ncbi:MAG: DUF664 domain-containing protein [Chloroflexi bacterium]|nr:DUF664 domain-containing protein [Chloroflexota bacterium]
MDFKQIIKMGWEEYMDELRKALDGLTSEERRFQPTPDSHHIDFAVWHMARVEDLWVQGFAQGTQQIWQKDGWSEKFGIPERDSGFGYTLEQLADLPQFDIDDIMAYYDSVRRETLRHLDGLTADELARCPNEERRPGYSIGKMYSHIIVEESQHVGQIAYIRGMQRGLNK